MKISILYGTETGNAEMLAEDIQSALSDTHQTACANLADTCPGALNADELYVIVCSTYGEGDLPASARPFAELLEKEAPDLSGVRFAIFGLGDAEYAKTFTYGSMKLARLLIVNGAVQVGERMTHDASGEDLPEDLALPWITDILGRISARSAAE